MMQNFLHGKLSEFTVDRFCFEMAHPMTAVLLCIVILMFRCICSQLSVSSNFVFHLHLTAKDIDNCHIAMAEVVGLGNKL